MDTVKEGTTAYLTVTFLDRTGAPAAPQTASWEADDVFSGAHLSGPTALIVGMSVDITIPPAVQVILDDSKAQEQRRITIRATYGAGDALNGSFDYLVANLSAI